MIDNKDLDRAKNRKRDELIYEKAYIELENGKINKGVWAKSMIESKGDKELLKSLYLKNRIQSIKDELLLNNYNNQNIIIFDYYNYLKNKEIEILIIQFIKKNIWYFRIALIAYIRYNKQINLKAHDLEIEKHILLNDLKYVFPIYLKGPPKNAYEKFYYGPYMEKYFYDLMINSLNNRIAGEVLSSLEGSSLLYLWGVKINKIH